MSWFYFYQQMNIVNLAMWCGGGAHTYTLCLYRDHLIKEQETKRNGIVWFAFYDAGKKHEEWKKSVAANWDVQKHNNSNERQEMLKLIILAAHH